MAHQIEPTIQLGSLKLTGTAARVVGLGIPAALLALALYLAPPAQHWPMWISAAGWVGFSTYWSCAAGNSAEAKRSESAGSRRIHVLVLTAGQLLLFIPVWGVNQFILTASPVWIPLGLAIQAASIALAVWARRHLGSNWSGRIEIKTEHQLVQGGPYRRLRHPIYTAVLGMSIGTALVSGRVHAFVGVALVVAAYWRKIRMEEANMRQAFGEQYDAYRRTTWGMIPGLF